VSVLPAILSAYPVFRCPLPPDLDLFNIVAVDDFNSEPPSPPLLRFLAVKFQKVAVRLVQAHLSDFLSVFQVFQDAGDAGTACRSSSVDHRKLRFYPAYRLAWRGPVFFKAFRCCEATVFGRLAGSASAAIPLRIVGEFLVQRSFCPLRPNLGRVLFFAVGAMENKSLNIFNSRLVLATPETATDSDYTAIEGVVGHEYFHNWTGNRVTCHDWFQLSLKEGLTVYRHQVSRPADQAACL
jgi:hypothetical protein